MTTNKPEVFEVYRTKQGTRESVVLLDDYEALQAECDALVEALEAVVFYHDGVKPNDVNLMIRYSEMLSKVRGALAAHRKGGGQ